VRVEAVPGGDDGSVLDRIDLSRYFVLASVAMLISFIAFLVVPVILSEEIERKTLDALLLAARPAEVMVAKALVGLLYTLVAVPLTLVLTDLRPEDPLRFTAGALGLAVGLIGFGLLFALALGNANRVNTWSGIAVLVVTIPVFLVSAPLSDAASLAMAGHAHGGRDAPDDRRCAGRGAVRRLRRLRRRPCGVGGARLPGPDPVPRPARALNVRGAPGVCERARRPPGGPRTRFDLRRNR
jgi:MFS family permease